MDGPDRTADAAKEVARLKTMLSTVSECFKVVDEQYRLVDMNPTGLELIEAESLESVTGASVLDLVLPEHHESFKSGIRKALEGERVIQRFEICGLNGTHRWMEQVAVALPDRGDGSPREIAAFTRDITETLSTMEKLRAARDDAEAASRAKSTFLANMSHEIRTPMTAIMGYLDILREKGVAGALASDAFDTVNRNARHLLTVIDDILNVSKIEAGMIDVDYKPTDPANIASDVAELLRPCAAERGLTLTLEALTPLPAEVSTDPVRLRQALLNIVGNALKFTTDGGVAIGIEHEGVDGSGVLRFRVADTGMGMSPDHLARIARFDAFSQADASVTRRYGGTGLGLHVANKFAELLGGGLSVESRLGEGSVFTITVATGHAPEQHGTVAGPIGRVESGAGSEPASGETGVGDLNGARILLAEDGPDNQRLFMHFLGGAGASVELADNGRAALESVSCADESQWPDIILMDMQMPEMDGYAASEAIRRAGFTGPIIALTAHAMQGDRERCLGVGCDDYLTKPIERAKLISVCAGWGSGRAAA